jgi:hypothetical protein
MSSDTVKLTDIQPNDGKSGERGELRFNLLCVAAIWADLMTYEDDPNEVEIKREDLPKLRDAIEVKGAERRSTQVGVAGPFSTRSGYQTRYVALFKAPVPQTLLARFDRICG